MIGAADPTPPKDGPPVSESFDAVVVCVPAPAALSMLTLLPVAQGTPYLDPAVTTYAITQRWDARVHPVMSWGNPHPLLLRAVTVGSTHPQSFGSVWVSAPTMCCY